MGPVCCMFRTTLVKIFALQCGDTFFHIVLYVLILFSDILFFCEKTLKAAIRSSVPKLARLLPKRHAKTLQTPPTAQLTLIEACQHTNWCLLAVELAMSCV